MDNWEVSGWRVLASEAAFEEHVQVMRDRLRTPRGAEMRYIWLRGSDAVAVLAFADEQTVIVEQQYRRPLRRMLLDLPAGGVEPTETPEQAIRRELLEETGYVPEELRPLGRFYPVPGLLSYTVHLFEAHARKAIEPKVDDTEIVEVVPMRWQDLLEMVVHGDDTVDVTLAYAVLLYAARHAVA